MKTTLKINRKGTFNTTPDQATEHQCVAKEHRSYAFDCQVQLLEPTLDQRGFIADHEEINAVIQNVAKGRIPSCELLAKALAEGVSKFLITREIHHEYVYIKLKADNHVALAWMEAWARPEEEDFIRASDAQTLQPAKKYRVLSADEIRAVAGVYRDTDAGLLRHSRFAAAFDDKDLKALAVSYYLSEAEAEQMSSRIQGDLWYHHLSIAGQMYAIPMWAIVEATMEPEAKPVEAKKRYRFLTFDEVKAITTYETGLEERWHLKDDFSRTSNYMTTNEINKANGRELTEKEVADYLKAKSKDENDFESEVGMVTYFWFVKELEEVPAEAPKPKLYRIKTVAEFDADPSAVRTDKGWLHKNGQHFNVTQNWRMDVYHDLVLTEEQSRTLDNGNTFYLGTDWSESGPGGTIAPWMVVPAETPIPEVTTPVALATWRFKTEEEFKADPDIQSQSQGYFVYTGTGASIEKAFTSGMAIAFGKPVPETALKALLRNNDTIIRNVEIDPALNNGGGWNYAKWMITDAPLPETKKVWRIKTWDEMAAEYSIDGDGDIDLPLSYFEPVMKHLCGIVVPDGRIEEIIEGSARVVDAEFGVAGNKAWTITKEMITDKPMRVVEAPKPVWRMLTKAEVDAKHVSEGQLRKLEDLKQYGRILTDDEVEAIAHGPNSQYMGHTFYRGFSWAKNYGIASYDITSDPLPEKKYRIRKYEDMEADTATYYKDSDGDIWTIDRRVGKYVYDISMRDLGGYKLSVSQVADIRNTGSTVVANKDSDRYSIAEWMIEEYTG